MQFSLFSKNKGKIILLLCLFILIVLISGIIIYLDYNQNRVSSNNVAVPLGLKNYAQLKSDVNNLVSDPTLAQSPNYFKFSQKLVAVEDNNIAAKDKYQSLVIAYTYLREAYSQTNNHALYSLPQEVNNFTKVNFSAYYKQEDFDEILCQDKICEDEPQPPAMLEIVNEINTSSIPDVVKKTFVSNLLNVGYISKKDLYNKVFNYMTVADVFAASGALTDAGLNTKLSQEIRDYVQKTYPDQYNTFKK